MASVYVVEYLYSKDIAEETSVVKVFRHREDAERFVSVWQDREGPNNGKYFCYEVEVEEAFTDAS